MSDRTTTAPVLHNVMSQIAVLESRVQTLEEVARHVPSAPPVLSKVDEMCHVEMILEKAPVVPQPDDRGPTAEQVLDWIREHRASQNPMGWSEADRKLYGMLPEAQANTPGPGVVGGADYEF